MFDLRIKVMYFPPLVVSILYILKTVFAFCILFFMELVESRDGFFLWVFILCVFVCMYMCVYLYVYRSTHLYMFYLYVYIDNICVYIDIHTHRHICFIYLRNLRVYINCYIWNGKKQV